MMGESLTQLFPALLPKFLTAKIHTGIDIQCTDRYTHTYRYKQPYVNRYICTDIHRYLHTCVDILIHTCIDTYIDTLITIDPYSWTHTYRHSTYMCTHPYPHMYRYTLMHTYVQTNTKCCLAFPALLDSLTSVKNFLLLLSLAHSF